MATFQTITTDKKQYLPLLLLADPCEAMIDRYLETGEMHVIKAGDAAVCEAVVLPLSETACELKNIATDPQFQGQGHATRLIETLFKLYAARFQTMYVGTTPTGAAFYARFGFEPSHTVVGFFIDNYPDPIYENGERCTDMLYFKKELR